MPLNGPQALGGSDVLGGLGTLPQAATVHVYDHVYRLLRHAVLAGDIDPAPVWWRPISPIGCRSAARRSATRCAASRATVWPSASRAAGSRQ